MMAITFPPRLSVSQTPTPLQLLGRLSTELGGPRIWVKRDDLTGSVLSGNKVRKLEYVVAQALQEGCDTLITCGGLQSNHCRATAIMGAQLGLKVHLILRGQSEDEIDGNLLLDYLSGARVSTYSANEFQSSLPQLFKRWLEHYQQQGGKPYAIAMGASDDIGVWGYVKACEELAADFEANNISPKYIVCATGSGGTQAGLSAGCKIMALDCQVIGMAVCDNEAYFLNKVRQDLAAWQRRYDIDIDLDNIAIHVNDNYIGPGYAIATPEIFATIKSVARHEGLVLDPVYTGKAFHGLVREIKSGHLNDADDVVFVHTGGIFGLFPQRQQLLKIL